MGLARSLARRCVLDAAPYTWVRPSNPESLLLMDANEHAWAPRGSPLQADVTRYPSLQQERLRAALADYAGVQSTQVMATCGADEAIDLLVRAFCEPGEDSVAVLVPSYPMYARQAGVHGAAIRESALSLWQSGDGLAMARDLGDSKLTFVCRPNNPTGDCLSLEAIGALLQAAPGFLVVDEAYIEFSEDPAGLASWIQDQPRLILIRTMSKAFGLAGARLGYVLAAHETIEVLDLLRLPFNVNALTTQVALEALADREDLARTVAIVRAERDRLAQHLAEIPGFEVTPSQANFVFVRVPEATALCADLLRQNILVRDRSTLPGCGPSIRITVGRPEENDRLLAVLRSCRP